MNSKNNEEAGACDLLDEVGFDPERSILTQRQAEVLTLRKRGFTQSNIADRLGTSRANVANIEASARENVEQAEETLRVVRALEAPVRISIPAGMDIYDIPDEVYDACNQADIKVSYSAPELMKRVLDEAENVVHGRTIEAPLSVSVNDDGEVQIRRENRDTE